MVTLLVSVAGSVSAQSSGYPELDAMVQTWKEAQQTTFGYPASQESNLAQFYQWYLASGMDVVNLNNAGDPMTDDPSTLSTDAALFGGYLPFTPYRALVNRDTMQYESISVSGHKFFGLDSPSGLFICTKEIYDNQVSYNVPYLNSNMRMINCSRDALQPLKFWWLTKSIGHTGWTYQAAKLLAQRDYLKHQLDSIGWPNWVNEYSNTVFFRRPSPKVIAKYTLAQGYDDRFGGDLAHVVVMQHVSKEKIDMFIADLIEEQKESIPGAPAPSQQNTPEKRLHEGLLLIRQEDRTYNVNGVQIK